jgi:tRNA (guanine37-N1)-methyltransferase
MKPDILVLRVERANGEKVRRLVVQLSLIDVGQPITRDDQFVVIPLVREPNAKEWNLIRDSESRATVETAKAKAVETKRRPRSVVDALRGHIDGSLLEHVKHSFDIVGDIAIIEVPDELIPLRKLIGEAVIEVHKGVRTVLCKRGAVDGEFRVRGFDLVAGEMKTETIYTEHGCRFLLDVTKVYFSPRLATERSRVASQASASEIVLDMFGGVL